MHPQNECFTTLFLLCGSSSVGRAPAFQAGCREFEPRLPLQNKIKFQKLSPAEVAQLVELQPSKLVVASSSLVFRSTEKSLANLQGFFYFKSLSSVSGATSYGVSFLLKIRAVKLPFNLIEFPFTASQLPSLRPTTGCGLN